MIILKKNKIGLIIFFIIIAFMLFSCSSETKQEDVNIEDSKIEKNNILKNTSFENLKLPDDYDIRQFEGMTLNFIVENNLYANSFSRESEEFYNMTGINIKIRSMDFDTLFQKLNLDFISKAGKYQIVYVDPYQTLNRFSDYLEVLNKYNDEEKLPTIIGFTEDFFENQIKVCSNFIDDKNLYTVPFDSTTMILYYRKDIFEKYREEFLNQMGYDWTPGEKSFTWERYQEISKWIDENVSDDEVKYGSGHMAQNHNSIFCDFSNILASNGGDYFIDENINTYGLKTFNYINVRSKTFIKSLDMYKKVIATSSPDSINWNWTDSANAFKNGEIAMMPNWDENYSNIEFGSGTKVYGKVGYSILPYGDVRSANIYGGSGIGINKYATEKEKLASWLFITWATSKDMQIKAGINLNGGSLPTRKSLYSNEDVLNNMTDSKYVVIEAWKDENIYLRPKISNFYEVEKIITKNLHDMVKYNLDSNDVSKKMFFELLEIK